MIGKKGKLICDFCKEEITDDVFTAGYYSLKYPGRTETQFCSEACRTSMFDDEILERTEEGLNLWRRCLCVECLKALE